MSENESVMAVCAEWRGCIESADPSVWNDERIAGLVKTTKAQQLAYLARIEAAWRREKAEIEANALAVGGIVEAARHLPGNAAAMREAPPSDEQINDYRRIVNPTIRETVSKQTLLGIICMLRVCADDARAPWPYPGVRNIKPIDCDKLYEFLNAIADRLECLAGLRKEGDAKDE